MHAASACGALRGLQACFAQGAGGASAPSLVVGLVCQWACTSGLPQMHDSGQPATSLFPSTDTLDITRKRSGMQVPA